MVHLLYLLLQSVIRVHLAHLRMPSTLLHHSRLLLLLLGPISRSQLIFMLQLLLHLGGSLLLLEFVLLVLHLRIINLAYEVVELFFCNFYLLYL